MKRLVPTVLVVTLFICFWLGQLAPAGASIAAPEFYLSNHSALSNGAPHHFISQLDLGPVSLNYYPVAGDSIPALRDSIDHNRRNGWDAYTQWQVYWDWPGRGTAQCDLRHARLITSLSLSFPERQAGDDASPAVARRWNQYVSSLATHERAHLDNARSGFDHMRQILNTADCESAENELKAVIVSMRAFDEAYDARTHHGADQGAVFP